MRSLTKKINNVFSFMMFACIFLGAMNFMNRYYVWFFGALALFFFSNLHKPIKLNYECLYLLFFAVCIVVFCPDTFTKYTYFVKPFVYPLCYLVGYNIFYSFKNLEVREREQALRGTWIFMSVSLMVYWTLDLIVNIGITNRDELIDYWTKDTASATIMAAIAVIPLAVSIALLMTKTKLIGKIYAIASLALIMYFNLLLSGRTLFLMAIICIFSGLVFICIQKNSISLFIKVIIVVLILSILLVTVYSLNLFGMKDMIEDSPFYDRFFGENKIELNEDGRMKNKLDYLENMIFYPFGGDKLRESLDWRSAHDLYLDTYSYSSIFSFVLLLFYIFSSLKKVIILMRSRAVSFATKQLVFSVYVLMHIEFFLEPILRGIPWFFAIYCLMDGILASVVKSVKATKSI